MARPREISQPRGSVARWLDADAMASAAADPAPRASRGARRSTTYRKRQIVLDESTDATLERLTDSLRTATGTRLTTSHAARALLSALAPCAGVIASLRPPTEATFLPNNAPRFAHDRAMFERALADLILIALRERR